MKTFLFTLLIFLQTLIWSLDGRFVGNDLSRLPNGWYIIQQDSITKKIYFTNEGEINTDTIKSDTIWNGKI